MRGTSLLSRSGCCEHQLGSDDCCSCAVNLMTGIGWGCRIDFLYHVASFGLVVARLLSRLECNTGYRVCRGDGNGDRVTGLVFGLLHRHLLLH